MPKVILSNDRHRRFLSATDRMSEIMGDPDNDRLCQKNMQEIIRHLNYAGVSLGRFLQEFYSPKEVVKTTNESFKCACNRTFGSSQALSGHKRTCKKS